MPDGHGRRAGRCARPIVRASSCRCCVRNKAGFQMQHMADSMPLPACPSAPGKLWGTEDMTFSHQNIGDDVSLAVLTLTQLRMELIISLRSGNLGMFKRLVHLAIEAG